MIWRQKGIRFAKGRTRPKPGVMNKTEAAYELTLSRDPTVVWFKYEGVKLRLADKTFLTPDFFVMRESGELEVHEVKGFWEEDARVKMKVAAAQFPFRFVAVKAIKGQWSYEEF